MAVYLCQGRTLPYALTDSVFFLSLFLFFTYLTLSTIISGLECLSDSTRSHIKLSGHLTVALKHEGERFSDYRENERPEAPSLLLQYPSCLSWQPCPGSERPDVMPALSHCSPGTAGQRQGKHMTSALCGAKPAEWPESTASAGPMIAQRGESQQIEK